ncbi:DNA methyltransferase, partial [Streptomyces sp. AS02]|uniref:DNA-methyltransferase n=1 Tax=Streptomyces sp. AS02 TaxID=2938946 RepID=UPI0024C2D473
EALNDPDATPNPPTEPRSKPRDIWHLGPHRVLCGDSTDITAVEAMLDGDRAHCMWTDPPYGVEIVGGSHAIPVKERRAQGKLTIQNDGASDLPELLAGAFATATAALVPGAPVYIAHPPGPLSLEFANAFQQAGWLLRQQLIWVKDSLVLGRSDYHYRHEPIWYGFTDPTADSGRLGRGGDRWHGDNAQTSILEVPRPPRSEDHPTMKPVELITRCLSNSCPPGGLVYEPFGGSGSTLIAAHTLGRIARVVELDPRYVDVICRRYQEHTGTQPVLAATGEPHDFTPAHTSDDQ